MAGELFGLLGINRDDPRMQRAVQGAADVERLIDTLVALRKVLGISQADLAEEMETTQSAVSKFERAGADPRISTVQRYAVAVDARIRFVVDASACRSPTGWQASYELPTEMETDAESTDLDEEPDIAIGLAS